jgi:hypothetical protein
MIESQLAGYHTVIHRTAASISNNHLQIIGKAGMLKEHRSSAIITERPTRSIDEQTFS